MKSDTVEPCDGLITALTVPPHTIAPFSDENGAVLQSQLPGYWEQNPFLRDNEWCDYFRSFPDDWLSEEEKFVACKTTPRTPPKHIDEDLLDDVMTHFRTHDYSKGPLLQVFATQMLHTPLEYPAQYDKNRVPGEEKGEATARDQRLGTNAAVTFLDDIFGSAMQAIKVRMLKYYLWRCFSSCRRARSLNCTVLKLPPA